MMQSPIEINNDESDNSYRLFFLYIY